jgi:hypothetical protein
MHFRKNKKAIYSFNHEKSRELCTVDKLLQNYYSNPSPSAHTLSLAGSVTNNGKTTAECPSDSSMVRTLEQQCCGSGMFIPDPDFFHPGTRIRIKKFKYFNQK